MLVPWTPFQDAKAVLPWNQTSPTGLIELTSQCDPPSAPMNSQVMGNPAGPCNGCGGTGISRACGNG